MNNVNRKSETNPIESLGKIDKNILLLKKLSSVNNRAREQKMNHYRKSQYTSEGINQYRLKSMFNKQKFTKFDH